MRNLLLTDIVIIIHKKLATSDLIIDQSDLLTCYKTFHVIFNLLK